MDTHRKCKTCDVTKPLTEFRRRYEKCYRTECVVCLRARDARRQREIRQNDPERKKRHYEANKSYRDKYSDGYKQHRLRKRERHKSQYFGDLSFRCKQIISAASRRAQKKGLSFELDATTLEAIINVQGFKCSVTGTMFDLSASDKYLRSPLAPSIDRRDSDRGYTWDNIQVVAAWYNIFKNEWSDEDAKEFIAVAYQTMFGE